MTHLEVVTIIATLKGIYYIGLTFLALTILVLVRARWPRKPDWVPW